MRRTNCSDRLLSCVKAFILRSLVFLVSTMSFPSLFLFLPVNNLIFISSDPIFHISIGLYSFNILILRLFELDVLDSIFGGMIICVIEYYTSLYFAFYFFDSIFYDSILCNFDYL